MWNDHLGGGEGGILARALSENFKAFLCIRETVSNRSLIVLLVSGSLPVSKLFYNFATFLQKPEPL